MSKCIATLLVMGLLFGTNTYAQNRPIACQDDAVGGLHWERGKWKATGFSNTKKYILVIQGKVLTASSVAQALGGNHAINISCQVFFDGVISCSDESGGYLMFDPGTMKGAISQLLGGTVVGEVRDSLSVRAFTCQPF